MITIVGKVISRVEYPKVVKVGEVEHKYMSSSYQLLEYGANGKANLREIGVEAPYGKPYNGTADNIDLLNSYNAYKSGKSVDVQVPVSLNPYNGKHGVVIFYKADIK